VRREPVGWCRFGQNVLAALRRLMLIGGLFVALGAQSQELHPRAIRVQVPAAYPDLALHFRLAGIVKLEVLVGRNGHVKSSKVIGGNPVLARAAQEAVKKWEFEPAKEETTEVVSIAFQP
jgi:TonB family protein